MTLPFIATMTLLAVAATACGRTEPAVERLPYPVAAKGDVVDDYAGTKVPDPYRWMEALDSKEVADWVAASNAVTDPYLAKLPLRAHFNTRLTELWNYPRVGVPVIEGGKLFYAKNTGLQRQSPVFVRSSATAPPTLVIDPNAISEDGSVSLSQWSPSPDAKLLAYGLSEGGADWNTIRVRDIASGNDLSDEIQWMRFSGISWTHDSRGFFYSRYPEPPKNKVLEAALSGHALYYHRIGTSAVAGPACLRTKRSAGLDHQRRGERGRALPADWNVRRRGKQEQSVLRGSADAGCPEDRRTCQAADGRERRGVLGVRQPRLDAVPPL